VVGDILANTQRLQISIKILEKYLTLAFIYILSSRKLSPAEASMLIKQVSSRSKLGLSVLRESNYVQIEKMLDAYGISGNTREFINDRFASVPFCLQPRKEDLLLDKLTRECLYVAGVADAERTPIVTADGWTYWVEFTGHCDILEALSALYTNDESQDPDLLLREGIVWAVSSTEPNVIFHGTKFRPTREDRKIFELFHVHVIDYK
jgi:hypothetical protein